ncbi:MAG: DUF4011 domain-containing protein, partial [bacterium]
MNGESVNQERDNQYLLEVLEKTRTRLLDQTRRNRLLNYKESARDIAIVDEMPDQVYEHLVQDGEYFYFKAYEEENDQKIKNNQLSIVETIQPDRTLPRSSHKEGNTERRYTDNQLQTVFPEKELERRLRRLYLEHRTMIEETGANNLYLAIGFLQWYDSRDDSSALRSPLILLPVRLERERVRGMAKYRLIFEDEALDTNYSLYEKLKQNFDITLPLLEEEQNPESYWREVKKAFSSMERDGWQLIREMSLGLYRFNKQVIWHDLDPKRWPMHSPLTDKTIVKRILLGPGEGDEPPGQLTHEYSLDNANGKKPKQSLTLIHDADSSQHSALIDALKRQDGLVIEGPPGTGKSQTITNLIAAALDGGLSVLFVAEKMAALDVVYKRLEERGLGIFCLQLHGLKTNKKDLLLSILDRLNQYDTKQGGIERHKLKLEELKLEETKKELIELSNALTGTAGPEELPLHQLAWRVELLRQALPEDFKPIDIEDADQVNLDAFQRAKNLLNDLGKEWLAIPQEARVAWHGFLPEKYDEGQSGLLETEITKVLEGVEQIVSWLNSHGVSSSAPSLFETHRLLTLGEVNLEQELVPFPPGSDLELCYTVVKHGLIDEFQDILQLIDNYLEVVSIVNEVFDYQGNNSDACAEQLKLHASRLINVACNEDVTISELPKEMQNISSVIHNLESMPGFAAPVLKLKNMLARTLEDYSEIAELADGFAKGPIHLSLHGSAFHAKASVKNYFKVAQEQSRVLADRVANQSSFRLDRTWEAEGIRIAYECLDENRNKWFVLFNKQYRQAKRQIKSLLKQPKRFSRKPDFIDELSKLVEFCKARDQFADNQDFKTSLGTLFKGIETDWKALEQLINYSQMLQEQVGLKKAQMILADWDSHMERMQMVSEQLRKAAKSVTEYAMSHPFPTSLWKRPIVEIANTLKPWSEKLTMAVDSLVQDWCKQSSSLIRAHVSVEEYHRAKAQESNLEKHKHFDLLLRKSWEGAATNVTALHAVYNWIRKRLNAKGINLELLRWAVPTPDRVQYELFKELVSEAQFFRNAVKNQAKMFERFGTVIENDWIGGVNSTLTDFQGKLKKCVETISSIPLMVRWQIVYKQVCELELKQLGDTVSSGKLVGDECGKAFEYSVYEKILENKIASNPQLAAFGHTRFESLRERFAQLDKELLQLNAMHIAARLCQAPVPEGVGYGPVSNFTEKRLLIHEAGKKKRHTPIRQLVRRAGNALQSLKPCFLMSPISVAQYLAPGEIEFDLVVMDEASQIRPEDALGAIARGRKTVIVGDPKQLPPTSFFDSAIAEDDEAEETILDNTESILDVCLKQFPYRRLRWHYRSQHESLIQFSNKAFYNDDLIVFPSPKGDSREFGVHSTYIKNPSYRNGRNRTEAEVVVENIIRHFRRHKKKSLGVAAFNKRQAEEIQL